MKPLKVMIEKKICTNNVVWKRQEFYQSGYLSRWGEAVGFIFSYSRHALLSYLEMMTNILSFFFKRQRTSKAVQWFRILLPMQGHRFDPWATGQLSLCPATTEPAFQNLWDATAEAWGPAAHALKQGKPPQWEACLLQLEKPCAATKIQRGQK